MIYNENGAVIIETGIEKVYNDYIETFNNLVSLDEAVSMDSIKDGLKKFGEKIATIIDKIVEAFNRLADFVDSKSRAAWVAISNEKKIKAGWRAFRDIMQKLKNNEVIENKSVASTAEFINKEMENACLFNIEGHLDKYDKAVNQFYLNNTETKDEDDAESLANFYYDTLGKILIDKPFIIEKGDKILFDRPHSFEISTQINEYFSKVRSGKFNSEIEDIINQAKANTQINRRIGMVVKKLLKIKNNNFVQRKDDTSNSDFFIYSAKIANIGVRILVDYGNKLIKEINNSVNTSTMICIALSRFSKYLSQADAIDVTDFTVRDAEPKKKKEKESKTNTNPQNNLRLTIA